MSGRRRPRAMVYIRTRPGAFGWESDRPQRDAADRTMAALRAKNVGWTWDRETDAPPSQREGFSHLLGGIVRQKADLVLVSDLGVLSTNAAEVRATVDQLRERGAHVVVCAASDESSSARAQAPYG